jgi:protein TonB
MVTPGALPDEIDNTHLSQERFGFGLFVSICAHVMLILGVGFTVINESQTLTSMDITLAQYRSQEAPDDPDFLAQANQLGSGTEDEALAPVSPEQASFAAEEIREVADPAEARPTAPASNPDEQVLATDSGAQSVLTRNEEVRPVTDTGKVNDAEPTELADAVASLRAQLDLRRQEYARRPRRYTVRSASTREARDAVYLDNWRKRIESIGNLNYPVEASSQGIYGTLRMLVALNPDGTVNDIRILRTSGEQVLDDAAIRIVQLAAPFSPFPPEMRADVDVLEIIRTWQFQRGNTFTSF